MLEIDGLVSGYGRVEALHGVSLTVRKGEIVTLIGANGAGKTTTLRCISGVQSIRSGEIRFEGQRIDGLPAHKRVALGLVQVPEGRLVFNPMSVEDNLKLGAYTRRGPQIADDLAAVYTMFPLLAEKRALQAGGLSGGQQQMLAMGRAIMSRPRLLLLDEPSMGLAPVIVEQVFATVKKLAAGGVTILLVEQNAYAALSFSHRGYVMETGRIALSGTGTDLISDARVRAAYLGG